MRSRIITCILALALAACSDAAEERVQATPGGYGLPADIEYAKQLWTALERDGRIGPSRRVVAPQKGERPHGSVQQIASGDVTVSGHSGRVIVKANHRGNDLTPAQVAQNPNQHLTGYAVMFRREAGYDPTNRDWFWVVFNTDGSVRTWKDKAIVGRVDTGNTDGCIGCHRKKGGSDLETLTKD